MYVIGADGATKEMKDCFNEPVDKRAHLADGTSLVTGVSMPACNTKPGNFALEDGHRLFMGEQVSKLMERTLLVNRAGYSGDGIWSPRGKGFDHCKAAQNTR
jgi:hypothetical protein